MAEFKDIRDALAAVADTIPGLQGIGAMPGQITPPVALVLLESIDFDSTMARGSDDSTWVLMILTSKGDMVGGQNLLMSYAAGAGPTSLKAKFEEDPTLGGLVFDAAITEVRPPGEIEIGAVAYYGIPFVVEVSAAGE